MSDQNSTPKQSFLRFSLRSLLILTALVAAFFGGRVSMQPALAEKEKLIAEKEQERLREKDQWDLVMRSMQSSYEEDVRRLSQVDELERHLQRSAGNGQYFLGPIPARNRSGQ